MTGVEPAVAAAIIGTATTVYGATRKPDKPKMAAPPRDEGADAAARERAERRRRALLAARGHAGNVLTGPSGVGGQSKVLGG
jgi:hypothetical protein